MGFDFVRLCEGILTSFTNLLLSGLVAITSLYLCSMCNPTAQYSIYRYTTFELVFITTLLFLFLYPRKEIGLSEEVKDEFPEQ